MLTRLSIRDIVLIDRLDIDFAAGLSVLTGETGAGKSILLDAFALALGGRGDASLVRNGAEQGQVTAAFDVPPRPSGARACLRANDIRRRGRTDLAPRAACGRPHPRLRQRSAGRRAGAEKPRRGAGGNPRPARRSRAARRRNAPPRCSMPSAGSSAMPQRSRSCGTRAATPRPRSRRIAPPSSGPAARRDFLRHAVEELTQARAREPARKPRWPTRRTTMMQVGQGRRGSARCA